MISGALGQSTVSAQPSPAVAGDFASANPKFFYPAGPGGLVANTGGVSVGLFVWIVPAPVDADGTGQRVSNNGNLGGYPAGIIPRVQQGLITTYLDNADMGIPAGFQVEVMTGGDIWVKNDGSTAAAPGMKAYADNATGQVSFAATGAAASGGSSNLASIAAGPTTSFTASISGNVMTVTATGGGAIVVGGTIGGAAGSAGGDAVPVGTQIVSLLSGTLGAANSTYLVSGPPMNVTSTTITESYGVLTVGGTITGAFSVGDRLSGTGVTADTFIVSLGTGTGGAGTYNVNKSQVAANETIAAQSNLETKWVAQSAGLPGDLVKISANEVG